MQRTRMTALRPYTTRFFNPVSLRFAGWLPWFGILVYQGRKTRREYRTPINVFRRDDRYVVALTYGSDVQWVRNVVAAGGCILRTMGREVALDDPRLLVDPDRRVVPLPVRFVLQLIDVSEFLSMRIAARPTS
jgi:deazaflavin-dependent oxidoreductase (nitroreductase family)